MEEWKQFRLIDVLDTLIDYRGKTPKKTTSGVPLITAKVIKNGRIDSPSEFISLDDYDSWMVRGFPKVGDVVLTTEAPLGEVAQLKDANIALAQRVVTLRGKSGVLDNTYLKYYFLSNVGQQRLKARETGTTVTGIKQSELREVLVDVPPYEIQVGISKVLKSLDDKIELNRKINANLEAQAQALFKSWFVDFEPYKDGLPLIRIRDLKTNAPQFYTPELLPNTEYINAGDIVAGMDAEFIPYVWLGERGVLNQRCCKFKGKNDAISNYYILFLIKPELEYVQSYKTGTTVSHLGKSDIDRFKLMTPPLDVVLAFSERVNPMKEEVVNRAKESRRLASLRDTLLPRLMSGELKVNEIVL